MAAPVNWLTQITALTAFNLRTIKERRGSAVSAVVGIAGVVAVLVGVLSIAQGFERTMTLGGSEDTAVVLRSGSDSEMMSVLGLEETRVVAEAPAVARSAGVALASPELFVIINLPKRSTLTDANVPMRGVTPTAFQVRPEVRLVSGRMFDWGRNEVIAGLGAADEFAGLEVGSSLQLGKNEWRVVGVFSADGGLSESEIWTDAAVLQPAYRRGSTYQVVQAKLTSAEAFQEFEDALTSDPRLNVKVVREREFYAEQSRFLSAIVTVLGSLIAILMGFGAVFGALNTMYTAVSARTREIATLRALGFGRAPVVLSVLAESLLLALVGGVLGSVLSYLAFDGYRTATLNWRSFAQVAFAFDVTPSLLAQATVYALLMGLVGGLLPAIRAVRLPVAGALRQL